MVWFNLLVDNIVFLKKCQKKLIYFYCFLENEENILIDNKNNENLTKCWSKEKFTLTEACSKCDPLLNKYLNACHETGYREVLNCQKYGTVSRR